MGKTSLFYKGFQLETKGFSISLLLSIDNILQMTTLPIEFSNFCFTNCIDKLLYSPFPLAKSRKDVSPSIYYYV